MKQILESNHRYQSIDFIKCFAALAVVCIHTQPFSQIALPNINGQHICFFIDTLSRFAVPFFFMTSGFLFEKKMMKGTNQTQSFLSYEKKIVKLYLTWSFLYFLYVAGINFISSSLGGRFAYGSDLTPLIAVSSIADFVLKLCYIGYPGIHLWYLPAVAWSILILFYLRKLIRLHYLLLISTLLHLIGLLGNTNQGIIQLSFSTRNALFYGLFYCTLGYCFAHYENTIQEKIARIKAAHFVYLFLFFYAVTLIERHMLSTCFPEITDYDFAIATIPLSLTLFLWVLRVKNHHFPPLIVRIGEHSGGIYVVHLFILNITAYIAKTLYINSGTVIYQLLFTPLIFGLSYIVSRKMQFAFYKK